MVATLETWVSSFTDSLETRLSFESLHVFDQVLIGVSKVIEVSEGDPLIPIICVLRKHV